MTRPPVETTDDAFLGGRLMVLQPRSGYRAGLDAVFLAATVPCAALPALPAAARPARLQQAVRVLDVGAGAGTAGLCAAARCRDAQVVLLEREPQLAALARDNIARASFGDRVTAVECDLKASAAAIEACGLAPGSFDHVLANPPYHAHGRGTQAPDALKAASHAMPQDDLDDWVRFMARMVKSGGTATLVHKAGALPAVLAACSGRFGAICVLPLYPRAGEPASRILVRGIKGSRAPLMLLPGFILHGEGSEVTPAADAVLRDGASVPMGQSTGR